MARNKRNTSDKVDVDALRHQDTRANIPTSELRDFVGDSELTPPTVRYPRDPSLDPQLVWNGKDEQDSDDLKVLAVPIYIQEQIQPQAIVEEVRRAASAGAEAPQQMSLFGDFTAMPFEDLIEFYQHEQHWSNRMILGDSLLVMNSLAQKEGLKGKVQMIYLDPPYGIKFGSNWQVSTRNREVKDGKAEDLVRQPEQVRAFRDTWEKGIHSYLSYLRDRLVVARDLLTESGSVFVQIGDENVHLVRSLLDEVFGSENFVSMIVYQKTPYATSNLLPPVFDSLLWYAFDKNRVKFRQLYKLRSEEDISVTYRYVDELSRNFQSTSLVSPGAASAPQKFGYQGKIYEIPSNSHWKTTLKGLARTAIANRLYAAANSLRFKSYPADFPISILHNIWTDTITGSFTENKVYIVQTNIKVIERCMLMSTDPGDLVLDPTMGSGTTAYVAEQWGRRWITVDTSRVALALARTRLMAARYPYYLLADTPAGRQKLAEISGQAAGAAAAPVTSAPPNVKAGFVYEQVPHITLRDIANNEEIDLIHERYQPYLEERRAWLNATLGVNWQEWEMPSPQTPLPQGEGLEAGLKAEVQRVLAEYWTARRERQRQIDESIQRNSARETLYDRPYEDKRKVRVAGPFSVESLSPHRILDPGMAEAATRQPQAEGRASYEQMVLDNLRTAGVQNTRREERLLFDTLEPYAGEWLQARGTFTESDGTQRRVAVSIGSEHGTVTARQIQSAAKEAVRGEGSDVLLVCGFAFDAHASEESKRYGHLIVQIVRMNSDLMMGSVLKQTDRANLFMIFGEPDIELEAQADGQLVIEIKGLDIYDPTTGQIRNSSKEDIACWFVDTDYNEEAFFVRQAYFLGNDEAYDNLKRALRAEVDESAWEVLYSPRSLPFARPESGHVAVKVINHYGDEVLKVYKV